MAHIRILDAEVPRVFGSRQIFQTRDPKEAHELVSKVFCPHTMQIIGSGSSLNASMSQVPFGGVSLNRINYGTTVLIDPGLLERFFLVHMPIVGICDLSLGKEKITSSQGVAGIISPTLPMSIRIQDGCDLFILKIERNLMERLCAQHLGYELSRSIEFKLGMHLDSSECQPWYRLIQLLVAFGGDGASMDGSPIFRSHCEQLAASTLLHCQSNNYSEELRRPAQPIAPFYVKRAEEYIQAHADMAVNMGELAEHVGVSTRALYAAFKRFRGTTPMAFLKSIRLDRAHKDFLNAPFKRCTVTDVALRWGFAHLSQFAVDYKRRFGVTPSETLQRYCGGTRTLSH